VDRIAGSFKNKAPTDGTEHNYPQTPRSHRHVQPNKPRAKLKHTKSNAARMYAAHPAVAAARNVKATFGLMAEIGEV
jgi:hypothetical protein